MIMEKLNEIKEKFINYMNNIPVENRRGIVIIFCAIIAALFILKCVVSIMMTPQPKQGVGEKISEIKEDLTDEYTQMKAKHDENLTKRDSFIMMLEEIENRQKSDTVKR